MCMCVCACVLLGLVPSVLKFTLEYLFVSYCCLRLTWWGRATSWHMGADIRWVFRVSLSFPFQVVEMFAFVSFFHGLWISEDLTFRFNLCSLYVDPSCCLLEL